jgi:hypothetical protein
VSDVEFLVQKRIDSNFAYRLNDDPRTLGQRRHAVRATKAELILSRRSHFPPISAVAARAMTHFSSARLPAVVGGKEIVHARTFFGSKLVSTWQCLATHTKDAARAKTQKTLGHSRRAAR